MADQSDVENVLVQAISAILYPGGVPEGPLPASAITAPARIYRGWPNGDALDKDLAAGILNVSIFPPNGMERNVTRYGSDWQITQPPVNTLTATVSGGAVTIGGTVSTPQNIAIKLNRKAYLYGVQNTDTLATIAEALATEIAADHPGTTASGAVIAIANPIGTVLAAVGGVGTAWREVKRQQKQFMVSVWAPSPDIRDAACSLIDPPLADMVRFGLPDGSEAYMQYERSMINDAPEKELLFRRDLYYTVEYPTSITMTATEIVAFGVGVTDPASNPLTSTIS
jgi:hypothetical protein